MTLAPGTRVGPYEVTEPIGAGGMGEVYRARDTALNRDVALKVIPEQLAEPERLARFEREAHVLASLNHPNIGQIYGLEQGALVLELVEGSTLADRIGRGPVPLDEVLFVARQIADALEAAHERGIIHRDLKPANVKIKVDGTVKVLDFGLAKALEVDPDRDPSQSPTLTTAASRAGVLMGTAAYMSPEQAAGKAVDKRADIWAFGALLYEMLTGRRAFHGEDVSHTLAYVLTREVDWAALPSRTPAPLARLIRRCLDRDPRQRLRDIGEARIALEESAQAPPVRERDPAHTPLAHPVVQRAIPWAFSTLIVMAVAGAVVGGLAVWSQTRPDPPSPRALVRFPVTLPSSDRLYVGDYGASLALSDDGRMLAYVATRDGVRQLYRRSLDQLDPVPVPGTEDARYPFFAPDGSSIGFELGGSLKRLALAGGPAVTIGQGPDVATDARWGVSGTIVLGGAGDGGPIQQVSAQGGISAPITIVTASEVAHRHPDLLPDGSGLLFTVHSGPADTDYVAVKSLETGERRFLVEGAFPRYTESGHLVFVRGDVVWAAPFDAQRLQVTGDAVPVLEAVEVGPDGFAQFVVSHDGTLAYVPRLAGGRPGGHELVWVDRAGRVEPLAAAPGQYSSLRLAPDGQRVAVGVGDSESSEIIVYDIIRDRSQRLTDDPGADLFPLWSPDGRRIVFSSDRDGDLNLYWKAADGSGSAERLTSSSNARQVAASFSPRGDLLLFAEVPSLRGVPYVGVLAMESVRVAEPLLPDELDQGIPEISPDGRWIAYTSDETGVPEVYLRPFPDVGAGKWQVSTGGGGWPVWSPDAAELFYQRPTGELAAIVRVEIDAAAEPEGLPVVGGQTMLFEGPFATFAAGQPRPFDLAPDGQRFLMARQGRVDDRSADEPQVVVVLGWLDELERLIPTDR